jgi:hypothetical protein
MPFTWVVGPLGGTHTFSIECAEPDGDREGARSMDFVQAKE